MSARSRVAAVYLLGFAIDLACMFMLNAAYPALQRELHASVAQLAWVGNTYVLGLTVVIPFGAWLARRFGERRVLTASLLLFGFASLGVARAASIGALMRSEEHTSEHQSQLKNRNAVCCWKKKKKRT
ncbi:multidrug efflux MFS transporter, partial [Paraburkholderia sp. Se-20369]|nr:multidrug efflux MFS transporter [Paraburkholderia sp. Se-20369]